jgi:hypothetical protein
VEIDQRFSGVFDDPKFKRQTVVDKRGRATGAKCVATAAGSRVFAGAHAAAVGAQGAHRRPATLLPPA